MRQRVPSHEIARESLAAYATDATSRRLARDVDGMRAAGADHAAVVDRARAIFAEAGDARQVDALALGERMKAAGASSDEILAALRAHFAAGEPEPGPELVDTDAE